MHGFHRIVIPLVANLSLCLVTSQLSGNFTFSSYCVQLSVSHKEKMFLTTSQGKVEENLGKFDSCVSYEPYYRFL